MFGGEFTSPNQAKFYHYRDLWRLDLKALRWEQLPTARDGPSSRSGHRCAMWKVSGLCEPCLNLHKPYMKPVSTVYQPCIKRATL